MTDTPKKKLTLNPGAKPAGRGDRAPVRGINTPKKRPTLAEAQADRERREFLQRRNQALNEKMVQRMKAILEEIRKLVEEQAKKDNYDYVFDKSGLSTSQVPFLLYTKDSTDITGVLLKDLNKGAPPESLKKDEDSKADASKGKAK